MERALKDKLAEHKEYDNTNNQTKTGVQFNTKGQCQRHADNSGGKGII